MIRRPTMSGRSGFSFGASRKARQDPERLYIAALAGERVPRKVDEHGYGCPTSIEELDAIMPRLLVPSPLAPRGGG